MALKNPSIDVVLTKFKVLEVAQIQIQGKLALLAVVISQIKIKYNGMDDRLDGGNLHKK
jgi:hypothetical protein